MDGLDSIPVGAKFFFIGIEYKVSLCNVDEVGNKFTRVVISAHKPRG